MEAGIIIPKKKKTSKLSNSPKIIQQVNTGDKIQTQAVWLNIHVPIYYSILPFAKWTEYKQVFSEMNKCLSKNKSHRVMHHFELTNIIKSDV